MRCTKWKKDGNVWRLDDGRCRAVLAQRDGNWECFVASLVLEATLGRVKDLTPSQAQQKVRLLVLNRLEELGEVWR